jgi:hypothetical protein
MNLSFFPCVVDADAGRTDDAVMGFDGEAVDAAVDAAIPGVPVRIDCRFRRYSG